MHVQARPCLLSVCAPPPHTYQRITGAGPLEAPAAAAPSAVGAALPTIDEAAEAGSPVAAPVAAPAPAWAGLEEGQMLWKWYV